MSLDIAPVQSTSGVDSVDGCGLDVAPKLGRGMSTAVKMLGNTNCPMQLQKCRPDFQMDFLLSVGIVLQQNESSRIAVGRKRVS